MEKIINHRNEIKDFTDELAAMLPPERVIRAAKDAKKMIVHLHLAELRQQMGSRWGSAKKSFLPSRRQWFRSSKRESNIWII